MGCQARLRNIVEQKKKTHVQYMSLLSIPSYFCISHFIASKYSWDSIGGSLPRFKSRIVSPKSICRCG